MEQSEIDAMLKSMDSDSSDAASQDESGLSMEAAMQLDPELPKPSPKASVAVTAASFEEIHKTEPPVKPSLDLDFVLDIPLSLNVELGRNRMLISELLQLGQGSVVELTKLAGEPMDVYVNQRLIARGEVVVVNEKFGVRLTDIVSPVERINKLK